MEEKGRRGRVKVGVQKDEREGERNQQIKSEAGREHYTQKVRKGLSEGGRQGHGPQYLHQYNIQSSLYDMIGEFEGTVRQKV